MPVPVPVCDQCGGVPDSLGVCNDCIVMWSSKSLPPVTQTVQCTHCHGTGRIEVSTGDLEKVARESIRMFPGKKIVAIKRVREIMGCSLVDAKNACDAAQRPVKPPKFSSQEEADQWMEEH